MRGTISFRKIALALVATAVVAAGIAAVGSARNTNLTFDAKLGPNVVNGGEPVNYKTFMRNNKSATTHLVFSATFPAGTTDLEVVPSLCTLAGTTVTCDFGRVEAGVTSTVEIKATTADVATDPWTVMANWGFFDVRGQGGTAQSTDSVPVSRSIKVVSSADQSVDGTCLPPGAHGSLFAFSGQSSISMDTPGLTSGLCIPVAVQVVTTSKLMSFAPPFSPSDPGHLTLGFAGGKLKDKLHYSVVDGGPSIIVPLCTETPVSATNPACEVSRSISAGVLFIDVDWTGDDPFWNL